MSEKMVGIHRVHMDSERMTEELAEFWLKYAIDEVGDDKANYSYDKSCRVNDTVGNEERI